MKIPLRSNKDFLAGMVFIVIAVTALIASKDFAMGSTLRMGPGYFPRVLAVILLLFGIAVALRGLRLPQRVEGGWGWRPLLFVLASMVAFAFLMDRVGLIPSIVVMFFISAAAGHEFRWLEVTVLAVLMSAFAVGVFIYGLGLPYRLIVGLD